MKPELVLNEEQKNQRFRSSLNLRCKSVNTDHERQEATSVETLIEGTEENIYRNDYRLGLSYMSGFPPAPKPPCGLFSYENIGREPTEEAPEFKTEPFVRVSVIQENRQTPPSSYVSALAEPLFLPDKRVLLQNEMDLVWHYIHKKFRRKKETERRFVMFLMMPFSSWLFRQPTSARRCRCDEDEDEENLDFLQSGSNSLYSNLLFCQNQEETSELINQLRFQFDTNWSAVNFGEKIILSYMNFCQSKHEFQPEFWHIVNHNLRQEL